MNFFFIVWLSAIAARHLPLKGIVGPIQDPSFNWPYHNVRPDANQQGPFTTNQACEKLYRPFLNHERVLWEERFNAWFAGGQPEAGELYDAQAQYIEDVFATEVSFVYEKFNTIRFGCQSRSDRLQARKLMTQSRYSQSRRTSQDQRTKWRLMPYSVDDEVIETSPIQRGLNLGLTFQGYWQITCAETEWAIIRVSVYDGYFERIGEYVKAGDHWSDESIKQYRDLYMRAYKQADDEAAKIFVASMQPVSRIDSEDVWQERNGHFGTH